jgi:hypothetical protein
MVDGIPDSCLRSDHVCHLQVLQEHPRSPDVAPLGALVAAGQEDDQEFFPLDVIDPVARPEMKAHLGDAVTHGCRVSRIPKGKPSDADENSGSDLAISKPTEPPAKGFCLANLYQR